MMLRAGLLTAAILLAACSSAPRGPTPEQPSDPQPFALPYIEIEAENGTTTGHISDFTTNLYDPGAEASGRRYVTLSPGDELVVKVPAKVDSIVVRFSLPTGKDGRLAITTAAGTVNLHYNAKYQGIYGQPKWGSVNVWRDQPASGKKRHFWDEASRQLTEFSGEVHLKNTAADPVLIDFLDFERIASPINAPGGSLSFATFQPDATGQRDVTDLLQKARDQAKGRVLYIPEGLYRIDSVTLSDVTVQGAGLWRTRFIGPASQFRFSGKTARVADLAFWGETTTRNDTSDEENAFAGQPGPGSSIEHVWVEHKKSAFWVGPWGGATPVTGLTIANCRFRDTMADAINLSNGTNNTTVRGCLIRNTGDDALAALSPQKGGPSGGNNVFEGNLVQLPWLGNGIALYGGGPFAVRRNVIKDTVTTGSGLYISSSFNSWPFQGTIEERQNLLIRCGAHESDTGGPTGAIRVLASETPLTGASILFADNTVVNPTESAVSVQGPLSVGDLRFTGLSVVGLQQNVQVVDVRDDALGSASFSGLDAGAQQGPWRNAAGGAFTLVH
jgi:hypothetical protein